MQEQLENYISTLFGLIEQMMETNKVRDAEIASLRQQMADLQKDKATT